MSPESPRVVDILSRDEIRALTRRSDVVGALAVGWSWLVIAAAFAALARWPHPLTFVAAVIVLGGRQLALAIMMHEAAHGTLFRTRGLNDHLVDWLCARPVWSDVRRYRAHHLAHHAHTGTDRDPDLGLAPVSPMTRGSLARKILRDLSGVAGIRRVIGLLLMDAEVLVYDVGGGPHRAPRQPVGRHLVALASNAWKPIVANLVLLAILSLAGIGWAYVAWPLAYLTTFGLFVRVRSLAEHACMERSADIFRNTRTTRANLVARAIVAPLHVNLHLEHHLLPTVPWFRLPALGALLRARGAVPEPAQASGYLAVLRAVSTPR